MNLDDLNLLKMENASIAEGLLQLVSFNLGEEEFGFEILKVQEIIRMIDYTRVPNTPEFVKGVINLRGKVIPIIDLRLRLGMKQKEHDISTRIIVIEFESKVIGFIVDKVNEVLRIDKTIIDSPPSLSSDVNSEFITSIAKLENRLLVLLDLGKILTDNINFES